MTKSETIFPIVFGCLAAAIMIGMRLRRFLPEPHLSSDSKDAVKLAMGLIATMSALLLGLLVGSAKGSYDTTRTEVIQLAAKVTFLDRLLAAYGPGAAEARTRFREAINEAVQRMWPADPRLRASLRPDDQQGAAVYEAIERLTPNNDMERSLKTRASGLALEVGQLRSLLFAQSVTSIPTPLLWVVVCWLAVLFLSFGMLAPPNATTKLALLISAFSVASAIFLILELERPFDGLIRVSSEPMLSAFSRPAE